MLKRFRRPKEPKPRAHYKLSTSNGVSYTVRPDDMRSTQYCSYPAENCSRHRWHTGSRAELDQFLLESGFQNFPGLGWLCPEHSKWVSFIMGEGMNGMDMAWHTARRVMTDRFGLDGRMIKNV